MDDLLKDRIVAHRYAPDVYDPPTFEQMANRIEELDAHVGTVKKSLTLAEAKLAKAVEALKMVDLAIMENATDQDLLMWGEPTVSHIRTTLAELKGQDDE